ncbi:MAG TPA: PAS domain-containing protein [Rhizomicrobium sp.]|jgi:hypothetical protein|nr:PAS domain-containing protein [Rhizomicrobium sp.]
MGLAVLKETFGELVDYYERTDLPRHPDCLTLMQYWEACIAAGGFVVGRDIPARPIARLLRNIILVEPVNDATDFRIRLAGSMVRQRFNDEIKDRYLSELRSPEDFKHRRDAACDALRTGRPAIIDSRLRRGSVEEMHTEVILLPVTSADRSATWLLVGIFYFG